MGAMPQEIELVVENMTKVTQHHVAGRVYNEGRFHGADVVVVFSRWGKVAAASTATTLIERFKVDLIIFTGVAGGAAKDVHIGDIVVADRLIQHDFDASPVGIYAKYEIPLLGISHFPIDVPLHALAIGAAEAYLKSDLSRMASVHTGTIASGDQFIADKAKIHSLVEAIPNLKCIEMEGAALAQVAHEYQVPYLVIRYVSDHADEEAAVDFVTFIVETARYYSLGILERLIPQLR